MCLDKLDEKPRKRGGYGYKILSRLSATGTPRTCIQQVVELPLNVWVSDPAPASKTRCLESRGSTECYPTGFHIFTKLEELKEWQAIMGWRGFPVYKVQFKGVVASGYQYRHHQTIVARKIKVIEEVK